MSAQPRTVVIDVGTAVTKAGIAGANRPQLVFPTVDGQDALATWERLETIYQRIYNKLEVDPTQYSVLLSEPPLNSDACREKVVEIMFEKFQVPSLFLAVDATLSLYSAGRTSGVVVDSGHATTRVVPVDKGFVIPQAIQVMDVVGTDAMAKLPEVICSAISKCDQTIRKELFGSIVLSGGSTMSTNFVDRMKNEMSALAAPNKSTVVAVDSRDVAAWIGGSILASWSMSDTVWITKTEFDEKGSALVHQKCIRYKQ